MTAIYDLPAPQGQARLMTRGWVFLGLAALIGSGLFSLLLVLARTPLLQEIVPFADFFQTALVVHVDLSVVIWFMAFAGVLWSLNSKPISGWHGPLELGLVALGTLIITVSPFIAEGQPLMNNYIPVLRQPLFFLGLGLTGVGFILLIFRSFFSGFLPKVMAHGEDALRLGLYSALFPSALAMVAFAWSYLTLNPTLEGEIYYEFLFWGGGHVIQFTHTVLMLATWLWLAQATGARSPGSPKIISTLMVLTVLPAAYAIVIYLGDAVYSTAHRLYFTRLMEYGGLAAAPLMIVIMISLVRGKRSPIGLLPVRAALLCSIVLFSAGGLLGFMIEGINVVIPAHYHGSIVGVTLAFMGLTYFLLPRLGFGRPEGRMAHWQPYIYGGGQLMHITGLAWSGGYGVQRKTAGAAQGLENLPEIAGMALMGMGGLVAIIGGILFLVVAINAMRR